MEHHIFQVGCSRLNQLLAHPKGHQAGILAEQEQVQRIAPGRGRFHQVLVAQGEGICVHNDGTGNAGAGSFFQPGQIGREPISPVFHKHQRTVHPGDFIKAQALEKLRGFKAWLILLYGILLCLSPLLKLIE